MYRSVSLETRKELRGIIGGGEFFANNFIPFAFLPFDGGFCTTNQRGGGRVEGRRRPNNERACDGAKKKKDNDFKDKLEGNLMKFKTVIGGLANLRVRRSQFKVWHNFLSP